MDNEEIFNKGIEAGEKRLAGALAVARATSSSAARMTLAECLKFIQAYNLAIEENRPRKVKFKDTGSSKRK